jgi:hypothetical protein
VLTGGSYLRSQISELRLEDFGGFLFLVGHVGNCQHVKGLAVIWSQASTPPSAVREYKAQQPPLFQHFLPLVKTGCLLGEFEKADSFIHITAVGIPVLFDFSRHFGLLRAPLLTFQVVKRRSNLSIETPARRCTVRRFASAVTISSIEPISWGSAPFR